MRTLSGCLFLMAFISWFAAIWIHELAFEFMGTGFLLFVLSLMLAEASKK